MKKTKPEAQTPIQLDPVPAALVPAIKTATKLEPFDLLKLQNLQLRNEVLASQKEKLQRAQGELQAEANQLSTNIFSVYGNPGEAIQVNADGTLTRTKKAA